MVVGVGERGVGSVRYGGSIFLFLFFSDGVEGNEGYGIFGWDFRSS